MKSFFLVILVAFLLTGCGAKVAQNAAKLDVAYQWSESDQCSRVSPKISVSGIPPGTTQLKATLHDLDVPSWDHGGGKVVYTGQPSIKKGELKSGYNGPCPPSGTHTYQFKVKAIDAEGTIIGLGDAKQDCCNL